VKSSVPRPAALICVWTVVAAVSCGGEDSSPSGAPAAQAAAGATPGTRLWFDGGFATVSENDVRALTRDAYRVLTSDGPDELWIPTGPTSPRALFVTASDGRGPAVVGMGTGRGWRIALAEAIAGVRKSKSLSSVRWVRVDVVSRVEPLQVLSDGSAEVDREREGIALSAASKIAFLSEELLSNGIIDSDSRLRLERVSSYHHEHGGRVDGKVKDRIRGSWRFETKSGIFDGKRFEPVVGGHAPRPDKLDPAHLRGVAADAARYLAQAVRDDGMFVYSYRARTGGVGKSYNILRHAGTVYSMYELAAYTKDPLLLAAARRALDRLLTFVKPWAERSDRDVLVFSGEIKLGGVALAVLALTEQIRTAPQNPGDRNSRPESPLLDVARRLCRYLKASQRQNGSFVHIRSWPGRAETEFRSEYYTGEAVFALTRMHDIDPNGGWLGVARRAAHHIVRTRQRTRTQDLPHDHWLLYGIDALDRKRADPVLMHHALRIATAIRNAQVSSERADWHGAFSTPPRSTPTSVRIEGLMAAYRLAKRRGLDTDALKCLHAAREATKFLLQCCVTPGRAIFFAEPARTLGGFTRALVNDEIRIDYCQHAVSALLALSSALEDA